MTATHELQPRGDHAPTIIARQHKAEALARLGGGLAHDLNNILHVLKTVTELLRRRLLPDDAEVVRLLDMMVANIGRANGLTRDLLAFAGRQPLDPVPLNPNHLIANIGERLRQAMGPRVVVETVLGGGLWEVRADSVELETAILNLALNARDAMPAGGRVLIVTVNVTLDATQTLDLPIAPGPYVAIAITDSGKGMDEETIENAFDPYFTTQDTGAGAGLGLARAFGFVRQSGGHIDVKSAPASGTTVTVYLPRLEASQPASKVRASPGTYHADVVSLTAKPAPTARQARGLAGLRVLVVEDESLIGMLAEDLLEQLGCRMIGLVSSLAKALELARSADLDFALLDVDLGGEPVYPVAQALQERGVPFAFMSGYGELEGRWRGRPVIQKPFDGEQLRREIERALGAS